MFQLEDSISWDGFGVSVWKSGVVDGVDLAPNLYGVDIPLCVDQAVWCSIRYSR